LKKKGKKVAEASVGEEKKRKEDGREGGGSCFYGGRKPSWPARESGGVVQRCCYQLLLFVLHRQVQGKVENESKKER
jgi:hypothetical protein